MKFIYKYCLVGTVFMFSNFIKGEANVAAQVFSDPTLTLSKSCVHPTHSDFTTFVSGDAPFADTASINVTTGSLLGFSDPGVVGRCIQRCSGDGREGLSHVGIAVVAYPSEIMRLIHASEQSGGLNTRRARYTTAQRSVMTNRYPYLSCLSEQDDDVMFWKEKLGVFCLESTGTAQQVKHGLWPRVQISPLEDAVSEYVGDVCVRTLSDPIPLEGLQHLIYRELGVSYEKRLLQLLKSRKDKNAKDDTSSWFCSELVAYIYREYGVISDDVVVNNVIPKELSTASRRDFLRGQASNELWIKFYEKSGCCA